jgi:Fe-S oxidoreductase
MLGMRLVEVLKAAGIMVDLPSQRSSGYPNIAYGELENALKTASYNVSRLMEAVEKGYEIVSLEPTATYALRFAYPRLPDSTPGSKKVASKTYGVKEYLPSLWRWEGLRYPPHLLRRWGLTYPATRGR